ncbi:MAG: cytochrome P450 [Parvibaculaceae bacterium]
MLEAKEKSHPTDFSRPPRVRATIPMLGNAISMLGDPLGFSTRIRQDYGNIARVSLGRKEIVFLQGADGIRQILWEKGDVYPKPDLGMATLEPLLGKSVATLTDNAAWEHARKFALPLFTAKMLKSYFMEAVVSVEREIEELHKLADSGEIVDIYEFMHEATFRVLIRTVFRVGFSDEQIREMINLFDQATSYINARYLTLGMPVTWVIPTARRGKRALERLNELVYKLIGERKCTLQTGAESADMLDVLLRAELPDGSRLSDKEVRDNCMTMLFGGHETTAGSLTWTWGLLSANPEKRRLMEKNVDNVLGKRVPEDFADLESLDYVRNCFSEAMRLYPMFGFLFREASIDDIVEGHRIKSGDIIAFSAYTVQHAPDLWDQPERFIPERHEPAAAKERHKSSYLPFSQGKRGCVGERMAKMEATLMLAMISQKFELDLVGELPQARVRMSVKPVGGMLMRVKRRQLNIRPSAGQTGQSVQVPLP